MENKKNLIIIEGIGYTKEYVFNCYVESMSAVARKRWGKMKTRVCEIDDYINEALTSVWDTVCNKLNSVNEYWGQVTICINNWVQDALNKFDMYAMNSISLSRSSYRKFNNIKHEIIRRKSEYLKEKGLKISLMPVDALLTYPVEEVDEDIDYIILEQISNRNDSMQIESHQKNSIQGFKNLFEIYKKQWSLDEFISRKARWSWSTKYAITDVTYQNRTTINYHEIDEKKRCREEMLRYCEMLCIDLKDIEAIARGYHNQHLRNVAEKIRNSRFASIIYENLTRMCEIKQRIEVLA